MASLDGIRTKKYLASGTVLQAGTNGPTAIRIRKIGSESATSVTVTTATNIVLVGSTTTDTITFATYATYGAVVAAINATGRWEAKLLDGLMSKASASTLVNGAVAAGNDSNGVVIWDVKVDTSTALEIALCLSPKRNFDTVKGHRVHLEEIKYSVDMGTAAVDSVQVWLRNKGVETQLMGVLSVDTTETTINFAGGNGKISGGQDEEIIVLVKDAATLADAAGNFLRISGTIE